jgi:hypothetical protein
VLETLLILPLLYLPGHLLGTALTRKSDGWAELALLRVVCAAPSSLRPFWWLWPFYVERIEITDRLIEEFMQWCEECDYLRDAAVIIMADHGQGRGIGAHGHLSEGERFVPFAMWGSGVAQGRVVGEPHSILDLAPTISYLLGVEPPESSTGCVLTEALDLEHP